MLDLIFILLIGLGFLFFIRSWFMNKSKKVISLLFLLISVACHPEMAHFITGTSDSEALTMVFCIGALIVSFFSMDSKNSTIDKLLSVNLIVVSAYAVLLSTLINFSYTLGYYAKDILLITAISYILVAGFFTYYVANKKA